MSDVVTVINILKKKITSYVNPAVTEVAEETHDPFKVLMSCLLSLRTRDPITEKVSEVLFATADTSEKIAMMDMKTLKKIIRPVNYYITKAKRIKQICKVLLKKYDGKVPDDFDTLLTLKGVGRKTANIVMTYGFDKKDYIAVDTHVFRIPHRLGWVTTKTPHATELALKNAVPQKYWIDINNTFVAFGQNVCRPRNPKCWECPITKYCQYYREVYVPGQRKV